MMRKSILFMLPLFSIVCFGFQCNSASFHERNKKMILEASIYNQVSIDLAQYCESVDNKVGLYQGAYLPALFNKLGFVSESAHGYISPDEAMLETGDRENSYGYHLKKADLKSTVWELHYFSNDTGDKLLCNFPVYEIEPLPKEPIVERGEEYFDRKIESNPSVFSWHYNKIFF